MTDRRVATVLVQAAQPRPGVAPELAAELEERVVGLATVEAVIGAFDAVVTIHGRNPDAIAAAAARIRELDTVANTLTLPHIDPAP